MGQGFYAAEGDEQTGFGILQDAALPTREVLDVVGAEGRVERNRYPPCQQDPHKAGEKML